jgi:hypothetical protein
MRIRQVRPEFFTDAVVSRLAPDVRLTYIGLWCVADDAGWLVWDVQQIGAQLSPYESVRAREKRVARASVALADTGRLVFYECGCALIPKLEEHQRIGGNKSYTARDAHLVHTRTDSAKARKSAQGTILALKDAGIKEVHTIPDLSAGRLGNGREGTLDARAGAKDDDAKLIAAFARQGLPVKTA